MLGPKNYIGRGYQSIPIGITVEGANILTRNLIIFGQGAVRCHPFVLKEMAAARNADRATGVIEFDRALFGHIGFTISNAARAFVMALTFARFESVPDTGATRRYFQHIERFSASFAFATDVAMLSLGGYLKKKESISARLGDVLSAMYLASMVLKHHEDRGRPETELPLVEWSCRELLYQAQEQLHLVLRNFPVRWLATVMRFFIFPRGLTYFPPADRLSRAVADLVLSDGDTRSRMSRTIYATPEPGNPIGLLQQALELTPNAELLERRLRVEGVKTGRITALDLPGQVDEAERLGLLTGDEARFLRDYDQRVMNLINVDDFAPGEIGMRAQANS
jgi:acyl-CoA dehydrogenase